LAIERQLLLTLRPTIFDQERQREAALQQNLFRSFCRF